jgi:hypothetical protein
MPYRGMTEIELQALAQELRAFQIWREYVTFAREVYGLAAERIEVLAATERGGDFSFLVIEDVHVYDAWRRPLEPDFSTEWWQMMLHDQFAFGDLADEDAREDLLGELIGERQAGLPAPSGGFDVFLASRPPQRRYQRVYVEEAEQQAAA